jgi:hypothetical protein
MTIDDGLLFVHTVDSLLVKNTNKGVGKLEYIHYNPVKAGLCNLPEEYKYSSAQYYEENVRTWSFLTHYDD